MKRYLIISFLALAACGSNSDPKADNGKISTSLVNNPRTASGMDNESAATKPIPCTTLAQCMQMKWCPTISALPIMVRHR